MQLTRFTDYALRVLLYLGEDNERHTTVREVADYYDISYNHLIKVVHQLSTLGYIDSTKGRNGGIALAQDPAKICVGQVVRDMEPSLYPVDCYGNSEGRKPCVIVDKCCLRGVLDDAVAEFLKVLDKKQLSDLL